MKIKIRILVDIVIQIGRTFMGKRGTRSAAEFSYFLTLSLFPFLICLNWLVGLINIGISDIPFLVKGVVPQSTAQILSDYMKYLTSLESNAIFFAGFGFLLTSASAAFRAILSIIDDLYQVKRYVGIRRIIFGVVCCLTLLFTAYFSMIILLTGKWSLAILSKLLGITFYAWIGWTWLRFMILFLLLFLMLCGIYRFAVPSRYSYEHIVPGSLLSAFSLVAASLIFSKFIEISAKYSLVYGSLTSIIILMLWLYLCGNIIVLGAVVNYVLEQQRERLSK